MLLNYPLHLIPDVRSCARLSSLKQIKIFRNIFKLLNFKDEVEPIWATAAKQGVRFATFLWGRCDIPYEGIKRFSPAYCENFYSEDLTKTLRINVDKALSQLGDGVDAAIVSRIQTQQDSVKPTVQVMSKKPIYSSIHSSIAP